MPLLLKLPMFILYFPKLFLFQKSCDKKEIHKNIAILFKISLLTFFDINSCLNCCCCSSSSNMENIDVNLSTFSFLSSSSSICFNVCCIILMVFALNDDRCSQTLFNDFFSIFINITNEPIRNEWRVNELINFIASLSDIK